MYSRIAGTGKYLPERILTNADLEKMVETTDEWIRTRTGIEHRHIAADDEATSDLAYKAGLAALESAGLDAERHRSRRRRDYDARLDLPERRLPRAGQARDQELPGVQSRGRVLGFVYGLVVADQFMRLGQARRALVIGAETMSRIIDWNDRDTCVLFGDGAGAVILEAADEPGILYSTLGADGRYRDLLYASSGVSTRHREQATSRPCA